MRNTIRQVFHSPKFVAGFALFMVILLTMFIYPLINPGDPLEMIGLGTFARPGTYVSVYDAVNTDTNTFNLSDADDKRIDKLLSPEDRANMLEWFVALDVDTSELDIFDTDALLDLWQTHYDPALKPKGMTKARRNYFIRLNNAIVAADINDSIQVTKKDEGDADTIKKTDYVNIGDVANVKSLPLGTDTFGRDVLKELVAATATSIRIGLIAGLIATSLGLLLGLLSGYVGGKLDDGIMFVANIFTVIPGFVLLILIYYSVGQEARGVTTCAVIIGLTSWVWTARSVRSQVISLRNRDHVNLSKLSGHSLVRIIMTDILPYIASYVVMAFILQVSSGILAEAQLSLLGLGPKTTEVPTLGLMMNWSMLYLAHINGYWWAYFPVILTIAAISFSLNLMNTGLDQVFNPTLRD